MRIGTSYFINRQSAIKYYKEYHYQTTKDAVDRKLKDGEIHIDNDYYHIIRDEIMRNIITN